VSESGKKRIVILFFHPLFHKSRVNAKLLGAVRDLDGIETRIMYDIYPDFHINMKKEQEILLENDLIIWQHPFYWYSSPSLLKEWIDIVLEHGFAYGKKGTALEGKQVMNVMTVGGSKEVYSREGARGHTIKELLIPFRETSRLCRMEYLSPFVVHGTHRLDEKGISEAAGIYRKALIALRDDSLDRKAILTAEYINDLLN